MRTPSSLFAIAAFAAEGAAAARVSALAQCRSTTGKTVDSLPCDLGLANINGDGDAVVKNRACSVAVGHGFRIGR